MNKRIICILLMLFICMIVSCTNEQPNDIPKDTTDLATELNTEEVESEPEPEQDPESAMPVLQKQLLADYEWLEDESVLISRVAYSSVTLAEESKQLYPGLAKTLEESDTQLKQSMDETEEALEFNGNMAYRSSGQDFETYVSTLDIQVRRCDDKVVSLLSDSYDDYGQIEDCRRFFGTNIDAQTGDYLAISDVIKSVDALPGLVEEALKNSSWAGIFEDVTYVNDYFDSTAEEDMSWTLDYNGITFHFAPGDVADSFYGNINAHISFAEHPELFDEKYTEVPEAYAVCLDIGHICFYDFDGDGDSEELYIAGVYNDEMDFYSNVEIYVDDECYEDDLFAYDYMPYLIKTAEGKCYLYLFCQADASAQLYVYQLGDGIVPVGDMTASDHCIKDSIYSVISDPASMMLDTVDGAGEYYVSKDGMPVSK